MTEGPLLPTPPLTASPPRTPPQYQTCLVVPGVCPAAPHIVSSLVLTPRGETGRLLEDSSKDLGFTLNCPVLVSLVAAGG